MALQDVNLARSRLR